MGIGDLAEQHPGRGHELLEGQGATHQQSGEAQFTEHDPVEQPREDNGQAAQATLEKTQAHRGGKGQAGAGG